MGTGRELVKANAKRKGLSALTSGLLTAGAGALCFSAGVPFLGIAAVLAGGVVTGKKVYDWLRYRGEWGLRF